MVVVGGVIPALGHGGAQMEVGRPHLPPHHLQVVCLHTIVLWKRSVV